MNQAMVDKVVAAVLYEGYLLYPYRPEVKNTQRWTFGGLYPRAYCERPRAGEAWNMQCQCLVLGDVDARLDVAAGFLQLVERRAETAADSVSPTGLPRMPAWQEAGERRISAGGATIGELLAAPRILSFQFAGERRQETAPARAAETAETIVREQRPISGRLVLAAEEAPGGAVPPRAFKLTMTLTNETPLDEQRLSCPGEAQLHSLASSHFVASVEQGGFVSQTDPPDAWRAAAAACENVRCWPVLVGEPPDRSTILAAPIILYDYPQIAPESPGLLFDSTEIDEMLTLRIMTLTDAEKAAMAVADPRAKALLERVESLGPEQLLALHGVARDAGRA